MRAITVCVDYWDYLSITLPMNKHHFQEMMIVTSKSDTKTQELCDMYDVLCYTTDAFYDDDAMFNKWKALEEGLTVFGREGWMCILDADIVWPDRVTFGGEQYVLRWPGQRGDYGMQNGEPVVQLKPGNLYTPYRRMMPEQLGLTHTPPESEWANYPRHRIVNDFSGYSQIFHADDPVLGPAPWHQIDWRHAGGADTFFQEKWHPANKIRPPFEVLHLGPPALNWFGRSSTFLDGTVPNNAASNREQLLEAMRLRKRCGGYDHEKIR